MLTSRGRIVAEALLVCLCASSALLAQSAIPIGSELHVNVFATESQNMAAIALEANGDFVVVWTSYFQDGGKAGIFGRRFDSAGGGVGGEFQVNSFTVEYQLNPAVAADLDGDFVVVWDREDGSDTGIFGQRFGSNGVRLGGEFLVNSYTGKAQRYAKAAMDADGDFVVAWQSEEQDGAGLDAGVFARRFSSSGTGLAVEFQVNSFTTGGQRRPSVAAATDGDFVVAWESYFQDGAQSGVFARIFASTGAAVSSEFQVNAHTPNNQRRASVGIDGAGDLVIAWDSLNQDDPNYGVRVRRFDGTGDPLGGETAVNQFGIGAQQGPHVEVESDGEFVVVWGSYEQDGSQGGVFARRFDDQGFPNGAEFQVNSYTSLSQQRSAVAGNGNGGFVVAWESPQEGIDTGIYAQRFAALVTLDVDGDGMTGPLTDGLLVLRFLFGFTGSSLIFEAVGLQCTRCSAAAIEAYLAPLT